MSGLLNSGLNGSGSNLSDSIGRPFATSFSAQSATVPGFHHSGGMQGLHNIHGSFNVPNMPSSLASWNAAMSGIPSSGIQQPGGSISSGRFASNNIPVAMSQLSHGQSGVTSRGGISVVGNLAFGNSTNGVGGSVPGISSNLASAGNRNSVPGIGVSPILGNLGPRITGSVGNIVGGSNTGRSISSGGLSVPGVASRMNLAANTGNGSLNVQGSNRLMSGILQQAPQMIDMLGKSYPTSGGPPSQSQMQTGNHSLSYVGMLHDANSNENSPSDINDFPHLMGRPSSAGGPQGQLGSLQKQGVGISSIVQQNQEFSIQNEDFPALPGYKGNNSDFSMDLQQKEQVHDNMSMIQSQHLPMARSPAFDLGGTYPPNRQQQLQNASSVNNSGVFAPGNNQDLLHMHGSDLFPSSHGTYHSQMSAVSQLHGDQNLKSMQGTQTPDRFGLLGLLSVIRMNDPDLTSLALGIDLTRLGLNLNSSDNLHKTFGSPWSDEPAKGEPDYCIPTCYYAKQPPPLQQGHFLKFQRETLFYIFYSMPKDEAQLYAANELYSRGWFYHRELRLWLARIPHVEPLVKTQTYERGSYIFFDPNMWEIIRKDNFVLQYEAIEKPTLPSCRA